MHVLLLVVINTIGWQMHAHPCNSVMTFSGCYGAYVACTLRNGLRYLARPAHMHAAWLHMQNWCAHAETVVIM